MFVFIDKCTREKKRVIYTIRRFFMISAIVIVMWMLENWKMKKAVFFNSSYLHWNTEEQGAKSVVCSQQTSMTIWTEKNHTSTFLSMSWSFFYVYNMNHLSASPFFAAARAEFCFYLYFRHIFTSFSRNVIIPTTPPNPPHQLCSIEHVCKSRATVA